MCLAPEAKDSIARGRLPHPDALARLDAAGGQLGWTGRDGAVALGLGPAGTSAVTPRRFRQGQARICPEMIVSSRSAWRAAHENP